MCNLYRLAKAPAEVARLFGASLGQIGNAGSEGGEVFPGQPGLVITRADPASARPERGLRQPRIKSGAERGVDGQCAENWFSPSRE